MRAFAGGYYKNLIALYDWMGVPYHAQDFLYYFSRPSSQNYLTADKLHSKSSTAGPDVHFIHSSNNHHLPPLKPAHISFLVYAIEVLYLLLCYTWFTICCFTIDARQHETLEDYVKRIRLPERFTTSYFYPLLSSVATCTHNELAQFPASDIIKYKIKTTGQPHFVLSSGMQQVETRLTQGLDISLQTRVTEVKPSSSGVNIHFESAESGHGVQHFDHVVLAVPANVVGQILQELSKAMDCIPTTTVHTVVCDSRKSSSTSQYKKAAGLANRQSEVNTNYRTPHIIHFRTTDTHSHTESAHFHPSNVCAITNPCNTEVAPISSVIQKSSFTRVLRSVESKHMINNFFPSERPKSGHEKPKPHRWENGQSGVWIAGGWAWDGMVLLEGCVVSALRVVDGLGVEVPWQR